MWDLSIADKLEQHREISLGSQISFILKVQDIHDQHSDKKPYGDSSVLIIFQIVKVFF